MIGPKFKEKHPKLAEFIETKAPHIGNIIGDILPDKGLLGVIGKLISSDEKMDPADKAEGLKLANEAEELHLREMKINNMNTANARAMELALQGSAPSYMAKNVSYWIDIFVTLVWGAMTLYLIGRLLNLIKADEHVDTTAVLAMYAGVSAQFGTVMNFHRGSSSSARQKDNVIQNIAMQP